MGSTPRPRAPGAGLGDSGPSLSRAPDRSVGLRAGLRCGVAVGHPEVRLTGLAREAKSRQMRFEVTPDSRTASAA